MNKIHTKLGFYGLIPFFGLAIWSGLAAEKAPILNALATYATLIFSFIGGIYWAGNLKENSQQKAIAWISIAVMLWAWLWLLAGNFGYTTPFWLMALSFWVLPLIEKRFMTEIFSANFIRMRRDLSILAGLALVMVTFVPFEGLNNMI